MELIKYITFAFLITVGVFLVGYGVVEFVSYFIIPIVNTLTVGQQILALLFLAFWFSTTMAFLDIGPSSAELRGHRNI